MPLIPAQHYVRVREAEREISRLQAMDLAYLLGGGRNCGPKPCNHKDFLKDGDGGDCSWLQLLVCDILGVPIRTPLGWTGSLMSEGHEGPGQMYTIYLKEPTKTEGHTIGRLHHPVKDRWFECGGRDNPQPGNGVTWFKPTPERIREFPYLRHFRGY